jgi:hypothetical protein
MAKLLGEKLYQIYQLSLEEQDAIDLDFTFGRGKKPYPNRVVLILIWRLCAIQKEKNFL